MSKTATSLNRWLLGAVLPLLSSAASCSPSNDHARPAPSERPIEQPSERPAKEPAEEPVQRYIVSIKKGTSAESLNKNISVVLESLNRAGAVNVNHLKGQRTIFVTCKQSTIDQAMESGLIESVQLDQLRKPTLSKP